MRTAENSQLRRTRSRAARAGVAAVVGLVVLGSGWTPARDGAAGPDVAGAQSAAEHDAVPATAPPAAAPQPEPIAATVDSAPLPAVVSRPVVVLYGDSLAWEAQAHFVAAFAQWPDVRVETRTFGGTATCDWLNDMRTDATSLWPGAVVVEFSGNAFTPCMQDGNGKPLTGDAYLARYRADAETVVRIFEATGTRVYFAGSPIADPARVPDSKRAVLDAMYVDVAAAHPASTEFVDAGAAVLDHGHWTNTLPCLSNEPCEGGTDLSGRPVNVVRAPDTGHFCPVNKAARAGVTDICPVWSSGAMRFGMAMAAPVVEAMGRARG